MAFGQDGPKSTKDDGDRAAEGIRIAREAALGPRPLRAMHHTHMVYSPLMEGFMKLPVALFALAALLSACINDFAPGPLVGDYGGEDMQVAATANGVVMTLGCGAVVRIAHPVVLDASGSFRVLDSLRGSLDGGARDTLPEMPRAAALITGNIKDDVLTINLDLGNSAMGSGQQITFSGRRGQLENGAICRL